MKSNKNGIQYLGFDLSSTQVRINTLCLTAMRWCLYTLAPLPSHLLFFFVPLPLYVQDVQQPQKSAADVNLTRLPHRALVNIRGQDGIGFLQGLVTADVLELGHRRSMYSMLLNAQVSHSILRHHFFLLPQL